MPVPVSVSFRDQITGRINDLLIDEQKACAQSQNLLSYLAGALLTFKDEGVEFSPNIVLCDELEVFLKSFPGSVAHTIGRAQLDPKSGAKILKDCGPLSSQNWSIFIERIENNTSIKYGIFTYFRLPTTIPLDEAIAINPIIFCILIRKIGINTVEIRGAKGNNLTLIFSTVRESISTGGAVEKFARACCAKLVAQGDSSSFQTYMTHLLASALASSHGTIILCSGSIDLKAVPELRDAIPVNPALDFFSAFSDFQAVDSAGSILTLQRCEELLHGFLRCDGMIVFDDVGRISAYRVFYRPSEEAQVPTEVIGGARMRAFEGVRKLVGTHLSSALFRSQDGLMLHHGVEK